MSQEFTRADWENWKLSRVTSVTASQGNLALIQTTWLTDQEIYSPDEILKSQPATVAITHLERKNFQGAIIARGYRLWNSQSQGITDFLDIETFDFNPNAIFTGRFSSYGGNKPVAFEYIRDNGGTRDLAVPGEISVDIDGINYRLQAFDDEGTLLLVFGDTTNGKSTYAAGRFLFVEKELGSDKVILNFNKAFVPPCGFSIHYNCPMPPPTNRISTAIEAGERNPKFKNQYQPH